MSWIRRNLMTVAILGTLVLAGATGFLASVALGVGAQAPTKTITINVGEGATGPPGPQGPPGEMGARGEQGPAGSPGAESCPTGSEFEAVTIDHPGGHITLWVCVAT